MICGNCVWVDLCKESEDVPFNEDLGSIISGIELTLHFFAQCLPGYEVYIKKFKVRMHIKVRPGLKLNLVSVLFSSA